MNKEKQIEKMKREINTALTRDCSKARCLTCEFINEENCEPSIIAEHLYNAGYRKQSEGEWIEASNKPHAACGKKCSLCGARISYREYGHGNHKYCHKCGAKMKGGEE